jgi:rhodanese-related sulfurtransferase
MKKIQLIMLAVAMLFGLTAAQAGDVSPMTVEGATSVDAAKAKELFDSGVLFVDVRSDKDWEAGRIPDAVHLELKSNYTADSLGAEMAKADPVVIYCNGEKCLRSSKASMQAVEWGFTSVYYFRDGFPAWKAAGYPVE